MPVLGVGDAQAVINSQLVDQADVVMAFFDSRLGSVTPRGLSGTAEEIERAAAAGRSTHVWFSTEPLGRDVDVEQLSRLRSFQEDLRARGLLGEYADPADLAFKVRQALERDTQRWTGPGGAVARTSTARSARLRAVVTRTGPGTFVLRVGNMGSAPAENLAVRALTPDGRELSLHGHDDGATLLDGAHLEWQMWLSIADAMPNRVRMTWLEAGQAHVLEQPV
ncbi:hypothetical protein [Cellulomonas fengjieae]|uniref:hypothetical protein n=1 Tax=Cellulomonas fengjieae TaxID=2819978 RepID=UPI001AAEDA47|nr:hypothetical protein [Cellulomonas fengjieae]MBO3102569.1 hypothetical protein [Cellulomonas fengjieae]